MKKKKDILGELKPVEGKGTCGGCDYFYFDPDKVDSHYYISEGEAQGHCNWSKDEKVGTTSINKGCNHFKTLR